MMKFFRIEPRETSRSWWKYLLFGVIFIAIVASFFLQMSAGICPVP